MSDRCEELYCWTRWLQEACAKDDLEHDLSQLPHEFLKQRDRKFRWRISNAIASSGLPVKRCRQLFAGLKQHQLINLIGAKDRDGDTSLHSAVRSKCSHEMLSLLLEQAEGEKMVLLERRNKRGETALELAFELRLWRLVQVLLMHCIKENVLAERTGIGARERCDAATLLHKAMKRGDLEYLQIYLSVCDKLGVEKLQGLRLTNRKGLTPWYYLVNHADTTVEKALKILRKSGIDINQLYTDPDKKTTMLHDASRKAKSDDDQIVQLLEHAGAEQKEDVNRLTPKQRRRTIVVNNREQTHPPSATVSPLSERPRVQRDRTVSKQTIREDPQKFPKEPHPRPNNPSLEDTQSYGSGRAALSGTETVEGAEDATSVPPVPTPPPTQQEPPTGSNGPSFERTQNHGTGSAALSGTETVEGAEDSTSVPPVPTSPTTQQSFQDLGASNLLGHTLEDPAHVHVTESREGPQQCGVGRPSVAAEIAIGPRGSTQKEPLITPIRVVDPNSEVIYVNTLTEETPL